MPNSLPSINTSKARIKKASPGLDQGGLLQALLGPAFAIEEFDTNRRLAEQVAGADVLLVRSIPVTAEVIDRATRLRLIQRPGSHVEAVDVEYAASLGVPVCNIPGDEEERARQVAEHAVFLMLAVVKQLVRSQRALANGLVSIPYTHALRGKTLGLVGVGRTGTALLRMIRGFGLRTIAVTRRPEFWSQQNLGLAWIGSFADIRALLEQADIVSIHLPLVPETADRIGPQEIRAMKPGTVLINVSRAALVNRDALYTALKQGRLGGAGLDVFWTEPIDADDPYLKMETVVITPHIAGNTLEGQALVMEQVADNIRRVVLGNEPKFMVNANTLNSNAFLHRLEPRVLQQPD